MSTSNFKIVGMDCAEEVARLKRVLVPLVGQEDALSFDLLKGKMTVRTGEDLSETTIVAAVREAGLKAIPWDDHQSRTARGEAATLFEAHGRAFVCTTSALLLVLGFALHAWSRGFVDALTGHGFSPISAVFYGFAVIAGGWYVAPKAWLAVCRLRPDMNLLMTVAVIGAIGIGDWFEAATVACLFAVALLLESWSVGHARRAIESLLDLSPRMARCVCPHDGDIDEKAVEDVAVGAIVLVRPGERLPLDGVITKGSTSIDESPITGESIPVEKGVDDEVFAGTINNQGAFEFRATREVSDTTLARIIRMVEEAHGRRAPSERWGETFARYYTPVMMALAAIVAFVPPLIGGEWGRWFYQALVLLVIACPCALVISTPVSIVAALACAARAGVLVKGGLYIELPGRLKAVALDKTGTLTFGCPEVQRVVPLNGHTEEELLSRAATVECLSQHPLGKAIVRKAEAAGITFGRADSYRAIGGKGAEARVDGRLYWLGSHRLAHEIGVESREAHEAAEALEDAGHSVVFVGNDNHVCGLISVADEVRPESERIVAALKSAGIEHIAMLTGDNEGTARAVASATGVDICKAELLPADKVEVVRQLVERFGTVAMIGDGVNDAPAMAAATVGVAMGVAGTDAAIETADIALMSDDLSKLPWLIRHSRRTLLVVKQNIAFALCVKAAFVLSALLGVATLWMAIAADMGASLVVIFNGLRLLNGSHSHER